MALSRGKRWFLGVVSIPVLLVAIVLMWAYGWLTPTPPELQVIENSFEPYVVESGILVESIYEEDWDLAGPDEPFAVFLYESAEGYSTWELSEELREAAMADGWFVESVTDARDDFDTLSARCAWSSEDRILGEEGRFEYRIGATHECHEDTIIRLSVSYEGQVD